MKTIDLFHVSFNLALYRFALSSKGTSHEELFCKNNQLKTPKQNPSPSFNYIFYWAQAARIQDLSSTNV